jgi:hypothetical protein
VRIRRASRHCLATPPLLHYTGCLSLLTYDHDTLQWAHCVSAKQYVRVFFVFNIEAILPIFISFRIQILMTVLCVVCVVLYLLFLCRRVAWRKNTICQCQHMHISI